MSRISNELRVLRTKAADLIIAEAKITTLSKDLGNALNEARGARIERDQAVERETETRIQFGDLKRRLQDAETMCAKLEGYIARVHEDDVAHEELVAVGNDDDKRLVPKRKHAVLHLYNSDHATMGAMVSEPYWRGASFGEPKKPKHWTSY
jgi:hypothetical protein